ncbi:MAG: TPM domain-containing protein [Acidobacteriota bacterium]
MDTRHRLAARLTGGVRVGAVALALHLSPSGALALEVPPTPTSYVSDRAGVLPVTHVGGLERRLADLEARAGHQVIVAFFPSLEDEALEDFTMRCAEAWKVGRKGLDDGVIFFVFVRERRMRLEVGYGLEGTVTDALASRLLSAAVKPAFARADYAGGVNALIGALESVFRGDPPPVTRTGRERRPQSLLAMLIVFGVLAALSALQRASHPRSRRRGGGGPWIFPGGGTSGGGGSFGGGGFFGGGGSFGGGGASGSW